MPSPALTAWSTSSAAGIGAVLDVNLAFHRQLDRGNAQPGALGIDFNRFDRATPDKRIC